MNIGNLREEVVRRGFPIRLVRLEEVVTEGFLGRVENYGDMGRPRFLQQLDQHTDEAIGRSGRKPVRVGQRRKHGENAKKNPRGPNEARTSPFLPHSPTHPLYTGPKSYT